MRTFKYGQFALILTLLSACSLDKEYFDQTKTDKYQLKSNGIEANRRRLVSFKSNGNTIYGVFVEAKNRDATTPSIIYFHGDDKNIDKFWPRIGILDDLGYNIFIFDYQGYGMSEGSPSLGGIYQNSRDALNYLKEKEGLKGPFIYYGFSLGGIFAIELAANKEEPALIILESAPASIDASVRANIRIGIPGSFFFNETFDNTKLIQDIKAPILFFHGDEDETVSYENNATHLFDAAQDPKKMITVEGGGHSTVIDTLGRAEYIRLIQDFIEDTTDL